MKFLSLALGLSSVAQATVLPAGYGGKYGHAHRTFKNIGYYANWDIYARNFQPYQVPANELSHVPYAFANLHETGEVYLSDPYADLQKLFPGDSGNETGNNVYGCIKQLFLLKQANRGMKTLLSVGGWTYRHNFPKPMSSASGRSTFVKSVIRLIRDLGFDGCDLDWEYVKNAEQAQNLVDLLCELRTALDEYAQQYAKGYHFLISVAVPAGPDHYKKLDIAGMDKNVDLWNLMGYDYAGSFSNFTGDLANVYPDAYNHRATPFNTEQAIEYYLNNGATASKVSVGNPLYGRSFTGTTGLGKPYTGVGGGSWEKGVWDYKDLPLPGATVYTNPDVIASWSYDESKMMLVSYDTPNVISMKVDYIKYKNLGGGMWWETSGDKKGAESLISTFVNGIGGVGNLESSENCLSYPASKYDNLRKGFPTTS